MYRERPRSSAQAGARRLTRNRTPCPAKGPNALNACACGRLPRVPSRTPGQRNSLMSLCVMWTGTCAAPCHCPAPPCDAMPEQLVISDSSCRAGSIHPGFRVAVRCALAARPPPEQQWNSLPREAAWREKYFADNRAVEERLGETGFVMVAMAWPKGTDLNPPRTRSIARTRVLPASKPSRGRHDRPGGRAGRRRAGTRGRGTQRARTGPRPR